MICGLAIGITSLIYFYRKDADFLQILILFLAVFVALLTILFFAKNQKLCFFSQESIARAPVTAAHLGFAFVVIGIVLTSSFGLTKELNIKETESIKIANYDIKFSEVNYLQGPNFVARQGTFEIFENGKFITKLTPQLRFYPVSDQTTNEAAILHSFFGDLYLVVGQKDENDFYALRAYHKPFIYLIWLGCAMIFGGSMIKILQTRISRK